ncbi:MAG: DUF5591 domain-containing protein [Candidatus Heimdallarchaeota archaeon]|nr:DUF5591 domain-containing protein [Candidatus Heimdallarchaeota archaeon]MCK4954186.1 DUF5591 domain-containing protein [Candidatus Heimdallarchaeota archaeon]
MRFFQPKSQLGFARILAETRSKVPISPGLISLEKPLKKEGYSAYFEIPFPTLDNIDKSSKKLIWIFPKEKEEKVLSKSFVLTEQPFYPHFVSDSISSQDYFEYVESFLSFPEAFRQIFTLPITMTDSKLVNQVSQTDCSLYILTGLSSLFNNQRRLSELLVSLREKISPDIAIYVPGPISPAFYSFLVYSGIDFFDNSQAYYTSKNGYFLTIDRTYSNEEHPTCYCPYCMEKPPNLFKHNELIIKNALTRIHHSLKEETLRTLVEKDIHNKVSFAATLRKYDSVFSQSFRSRSPIISNATMKCVGEESLSRPVITEYRNRIRERFVPDLLSRIILLLPCSARKPYSFSRSHMQIRKAIKKGGRGIFSILSELIVTSPLSVVPRELEGIFPAKFYDIPVAGQWTSKEISITATLLNDILKRYSKDAIIINHMSGEGYKDIIQIVREQNSFTVYDTSQEASPTSDKSLSRLSETLQEIFSDKFSSDVQAPSTLTKKLRAISDFQFGSDTGRILFADSLKTKGKYPRNQQIFSEKEQIAILNSKNGFLSLSPDSAQSISTKSKNILEFGDIQVKGSNIFAPGCIKADNSILPNDEIFVVFEKQVVATAKAIVSGKDMNKMTSGIVAEIKKKTRVKK